jgi:hypothetical protein
MLRQEGLTTKRILEHLRHYSGLEHDISEEDGFDWPYFEEQCRKRLTAEFGTALRAQ